MTGRRLHFIGVCGTAMATLAAMLKKRGHDVQGSDHAVYPPMSDFLVREGIRLLAQTTGIFTETAGGVTTAVLAKLAHRGDIDPEERVVAYITGEGLKTLDAVRGTFEAWEIDPNVEAFEAANERVSALA